jgi:hypothetical protein
MPLFNWRRVVPVTRTMLLRADLGAIHRMGVTDPALSRDNKREGKRDQQ